MREAPKDDTLESMYKTKLNDSQLLETTFVLCNQDTVTAESTRYTLESDNAGSKLRCTKGQDSEWSPHQKESG